jgi:hypothetical protein
MELKADFKGKLIPRPYARLLTMIGEQLIKNEKVALIELIKNSYDADASWVQVRFNNFEVNEEDENELQVNDDSNIEIEDDGEGMSLQTIKEAWMNPASPIKLIEKARGIRKTKNKNRIIQGEKGIGRYSTFKLGKKVEIVTKAINKKEIVVTSDLTIYNEELVSLKGSKESKYLDEVEFDYVIRRKPKHFVNEPLTIRGIKKKRVSHGTLIRISHLIDNWNKDKIEKIFYDILRLESPFSESKKGQDILIDFRLNNKPIISQKSIEENLQVLFNYAPIKVTDGKFSEDGFSFKLNNRDMWLSLGDLSGNRALRDRFLTKQGKLRRRPECGPFDFEFYVYDFSAKEPSKYKLDRESKDLVKKNRIYLYRDGIRVFPYGDPEDDWLGIDVIRGTQKAGLQLSNDQTIGRIKISGENNPNLKDKTNREGLLEIGNSFEDFKVLILSILGYLHKEFRKYKETLERKNINILVKSDLVISSLKESLYKIDQKNYSEAKKRLNTAIKKYEIEKEFLVTRAETTEDLASVGLAVEIASHDMMMMMNRAVNSIDAVFKSIMSEEFDVEELRTNLETLRGQVTFVRDQVEGIQPIFKSSKRKSQNFQIRDIIERIKKYFNNELEKNKIKFTINEKNIPLVVKSNEAVLLQTFINLIDNSIYWLSNSSIKDKEIKITTSGNNLTLIFSDNGPGVREDDQEYIFEAFFTTKGIEGRGLGLYITDQLLQRYDHRIEYMKKNKILDGANFLINFSTE